MMQPVNLQSGGKGCLESYSQHMLQMHHMIQQLSKQPFNQNWRGEDSLDLHISHAGLLALRNASQVPSARLCIASPVLTLAQEALRRIL